MKDVDTITILENTVTEIYEKNEIDNEELSMISGIMRMTVSIENKK